ncbi:hypothetical protein BT63DRAFT_237752 [Microthyrium microscopicum]|uniref:Uncharacterized protein n=1 Tax=Microthyrium microscopicum TaxID=703497 RepID=A0A6A6UH49_9PEZI|nr:hypothetical protein BT63DRAFT_237752 [Microthyrium microscopicum]
MMIEVTAFRFWPLGNDCQSYILRSSPSTKRATYISDQSDLCYHIYIILLYGSTVFKAMAKGREPSKTAEVGNDGERPRKRTRMTVDSFPFMRLPDELKIEILRQALTHPTPVHLSYDEERYWDEKKILDARIAEGYIGAFDSSDRPNSGEPKKRFVHTFTGFPLNSSSLISKRVLTD